MRHKATHFFNVPHYANKVFEFFIALLNEKLKDRIRVSNKNALNKNFNPLHIKSVCQTNWTVRNKIANFNKNIWMKGSEFSKYYINDQILV